MQRIWGRRQRYRDRTVDVFVRKLRDKIDRPASAARLHPHAPRGRLQARSAVEVRVTTVRSVGRRRPSHDAGRRPRAAAEPGAVAASTGARACSSRRSTRALPLLERVKYCAFFSSHMDEFFAVRVAGPARPGRVGAERPLGRRQHADERRSPRSASASRRSIARQAKLWARELVPGARRRGDRDRRRSHDCTRGGARTSSARVSSRTIYPVLTPLAVGPGQPFPYISALSLSLAVFVRDPETGRGAARARQGAGGAAALRRGRRRAACSCRSRT